MERSIVNEFQSYSQKERVSLKNVAPESNTEEKRLCKMKIVGNSAERSIAFAKNIITFSFALSLCYAILRYNIMGNVPWKDLPFYIMNKALSLSSFILLTLTFTLKPAQNLGFSIPKHWLVGRKYLGNMVFITILIHSIMSVMILNPSTFGKFFLPDGTMTLFAGLSMLGGILSTVVISTYSLSFFTYLKDDVEFIKFINSRLLILTLLFLCGMHLFFMGYEGWTNYSSWHGSLPPISLIGFILFSISFTINYFGRKK